MNPGPGTPPVHCQLQPSQIREAPPDHTPCQPKRRDKAPRKFVVKACAVGEDCFERIGETGAYWLLKNTVFLLHSWSALDRR